jgi:hypothetical protein
MVVYSLMLVLPALFLPALLRSHEQRLKSIILVYLGQFRPLLWQDIR